MECSSDSSVNMTSSILIVVNDFLLLTNVFVPCSLYLTCSIPDVFVLFALFTRDNEQMKKRMSNIHFIVQ